MGWVGSRPSPAKSSQDPHRFGFPDESLGFSDIDSPQQRQTRGVIVIVKSPFPGGLKTDIPHLNQSGGQVPDKSQALVFLQLATRYVVRHERSADDSSLSLFNRRNGQQNVHRSSVLAEQCSLRGFHRSTLSDSL